MTCESQLFKYMEIMLAGGVAALATVLLVGKQEHRAGS